MNRFLPLSVLFLLAVFPLAAQITVHSSDMPAPGDSIRVSYSLNGTASVDHTLSGPNFLWDFSTLQPGAQQMFRYTQPTAIPFNFLSSVAIRNLSPDSLPVIGAVPSDFTDYYKNSSSGFRQNGISFTYAPLGNFSVPVIFTAPDYIYSFPLDYGDLDTSDAAYSFNIPGLLFFGENIHRESNVDGWGTLLTPYGTFQCLRVVSYVTRIDTIGLDSVNGFTNTRPIEVEYKWLAAGMKIPVLEVDAQILLNNEVVTGVVYQDSLRDSVLQVGLPTAVHTVVRQGVYPNPSTWKCTLTCTLSKSTTVRIDLLDVTGREVRSLGESERPAGDFTETIDLSGLAPGLYQLRLTTADGPVATPVLIGY